MNPLLSYALDWVDLNGGLAEEELPDLYRIVLDRPPRGIAELSMLSDDPETAREIPGVELVAPASRLAEAMVEDGLARGRLAIEYCVGLRWTEERILGGIARSLKLGEGRCEVGVLRPLECRYGIFHFLASFESDEIEREIVEVCACLRSGRLARRVPEAAARAARAAGPLEALPRAPVRPAAEVFRIAREEAESKLAAARQARLSAIEARRVRERARAERYYADLGRETCEDLKAARDPNRRAALEVRLRSVAVERERVLDQIDARHGLSMSVEPASVLVLAQPKVRVECEVVHKKGWRGTLIVWWDPLLGEIEPADCPSCREPGYEFDATRSGIRCARSSCGR